MQSVWRDIAVFLDASAAGEKIGQHAAMLAKASSAHLVGVYGLSRTHDRHPSEGFVKGQAGMRDVAERHRADDEKKILLAGRRFSDLSRTHDISSEFRVVWRDVSDDASVLRALHCDLIVAAHPKPQDLPADWHAERLLLNTGTPVLLVPASWNGASIGDSVMIAWNRSKEARRAVNDALPFIATAKRTQILTVDADQHSERFGDNPGENLRDHLARHGAATNVLRVASDGAPIADIILEQALKHDATLLVIGAYSHPRNTELLFGGVTRSLLANTSMPMLISR